MVALLVLRTNLVVPNSELQSTSFFITSLSGGLTMYFLFLVIYCLRFWIEGELVTLEMFRIGHDDDRGSGFAREEIGVIAYDKIDVFRMQQVALS